MIKLILIFLLPVLSFAQAPKKTNLIIVGGTSLNEAVSLLLEKGYMIDRLDTTYRFVSTKPKQVSKSTDVVVLQIRQKADSIYISGTMNMNMTVNVGMFSSTANNSTIVNKGQRGSSMKLSFEEMDRFAQAFNKPVQYRITRE